MFTSSRKHWCLAILVVALTFPSISHEFSLKLGDDGTNTVQQRKAPKKFQFHKIERVLIDDEDTDVDDGEVEDGARAEDEAMDDTVEYAPPKRKEKGKIRNVVDNEQRSGGIFSGWFSWGGEVTAKPVEAIDNGIIKWIQSFSSFKKEEPKPNAEESKTLWEIYLDRWPFNALFPEGKAQKPNYMPKRSTIQSDMEGEPMSQEHFESLLHTVPGFVVNASHVSDIDCKQQMQIFHHQLRGHKLWTLQMLDSTGKFTSGMLRGNINQFGDFDLCTHIRTVVKVTPKVPLRIKGKYCLAHIETQAAADDLRIPVYMAHGRELWNSHLGNPSHFVPRYSVASWGVCVPNLCPASVVREMIETNLRPYNTTGVNFRIEVNENDCFVRQSRSIAKIFRKDGYVGFTLGYIAFFMVVVSTTLVLENWEVFQKLAKRLTVLCLISFQEASKKLLKATESQDKGDVPEEVEEEKGTTEAEEPKEEQDAAPEETSENVEEGGVAEEIGTPLLQDTLKQIIESFSVRRTLSELLSCDKPDLQFPLFHGLRVVSTIMIYFCLKFIMIGHLPFVNRDSLVKSMESPFSIVFRSPMLYMDVLLIINGFVAAYSTSEEIEQKSRIFVLKRITAKLLRFLPTLYAVIFFQTWILPHLGSGPLWGRLVMQNSHICGQNMWRNLFAVQNAVGFEETCSPMSTQLALELQLFLLAPLIVWLYHTDTDAAFLVYGVISAMSVAARFSRTNRELLSSTIFHGMNVSKFYRTANIMFSSPISRATSYLIGIGAAIVYRSTGGDIEMSEVTRKAGWATAAFGIFWCFWDQSFGTRVDFVYNSADAASYASWAPMILGFSVALLIFLMPRDDSFINRVLTSRPVLFASRISLPIQLVTFVVTIYRTAGVKETLKFHILHMIDVPEIVLIVVFATLLAFLIDIPMQTVRKIVVNKFFSEKVPDSGEEELPADELSESGVESKPQTPEPVEDIWGSDQEEESASKEPSQRPQEQTEETEAAKDETEEAEEEEETEITEEEEVKRRPESPLENEKEPEPDPEPEERPAYRRRRFVKTDDE